MDGANVDYVDGQEITVVNPDHVTEIRLTGDGRIVLPEFCDSYLRSLSQIQKKETGEDLRDR